MILDWQANVDSYFERLVEQASRRTQMPTRPTLAIPLKCWSRNGEALLHSSPAKGSLHSCY
jgi:hypothetical protein